MSKGSGLTRQQLRRMADEYERERVGPGYQRWFPFTPWLRFCGYEALALASGTIESTEGVVPLRVRAVAFGAVRDDQKDGS